MADITLISIAQFIALLLANILFFAMTSLIFNVFVEDATWAMLLGFFMIALIKMVNKNG